MKTCLDTLSILTDSIGQMFFKFISAAIGGAADGLLSFFYLQAIIFFTISFSIFSFTRLLINRLF